MSTQSGQAVIQALNALYQNPNPQAKEEANVWLQDYQKTDQAWTESNVLLLAQDVPPEVKLFAAQTFRAKINYDLSQLPPAHRPGLRDSLVSALRTFASGPKVIRTQICLSLADLSLQMPEWTGVISNVIETFGNEPTTVPALLEFLTVLPQEVTGNLRIELLNEEFRTREAVQQVASVLSMYIQASGVTPEIQQQVMSCLASWLHAGEMPSSLVVDTSLFPFAFDALSSPTTSSELFDTSTDAICDLIHETQELAENMSVIERIVPRLVVLKDRLGPLIQASTETEDDEVSDRIRGLTRIFSEAGEWYEPLMMQHPGTFLPIVQALLQCAAFEDLDIVTITINFWYKLAKGLRKRKDDPSITPLLEVFSNLIDAIVRHLYYPEGGDLTGQDRDDFRDFRHVIGDTLKDCCAVLGTTVCLRRSYDLIASVLSSGTPLDQLKWQQIEGPLFSMRSMGAEVDPNDNEIIPSIMEIIQRLPPHPKIRTAAILVISRYTEWVDRHPEHIPFLLSYVSAGFEVQEEDVSAAAAQAMKYLCRDCSQHLVPYLEQLHSFFTTYGPKLPQEDMIDISLGIAHVIASMPAEPGAQALMTFVMPMVEDLHNTISKPGFAGSKEDIRLLCNILERIDAFLATVDRFTEGLPASCVQTISTSWAVIDALITLFPGNYSVAERSCAVIRRGFSFFGELIDPNGEVLQRVVDKMADAFEISGLASYLWIEGKCIGLYGRTALWDRAASQGSQIPQGGMKGRMRASIERETVKLDALVQSNGPTQIPDVLDDYIHLIGSGINYSPDIIFLSSAFGTSFQLILQAFSLPAPETIDYTLEIVREIVGHDSLRLAASPIPSPNADAELGAGPASPLYAVPIRAAVSSQGLTLVALLLNGIVGSFPEDCVERAIPVMRHLCEGWPTEIVGWVSGACERGALGQGGREVGPEAKDKFLADFASTMAQNNLTKIKDVLVSLLKAARKTRDRTRFMDGARR